MQRLLLVGRGSGRSGEMIWERRGGSRRGGEWRFQGLLLAVLVAVVVVVVVVSMMAVLPPP